MTMNRLRVLVLTKRQYMKKDLLDDRYGRMREIPLELAKRGHDVRGLCLSYSFCKANEVWDGPVEWRSINATPLKFPGLIRFMRTADTMARNADVIWAGSDSIYGIIAHWVGRRNGIPVVFDLYDNFSFFAMARFPVVKQLYRRALRHCDLVSCNGNALASLVRSYGREKPIVVLQTTARTDLFRPMNRSECRKRLGLPVDARIVGTAGALTVNHGIEKLIHAFCLLEGYYDDLRLTLAGPREEGLDLGGSSRIVDLGILSHDLVPFFINALDVAVICNAENAFGRYCFPQKAWEIMACDIPLIAAGVDGMKDFFSEQSEWLYAPGSSSSLAVTLARRLSDRSTGYPEAPTWAETAMRLEKAMLAIALR